MSDFKLLDNKQLLHIASEVVVLVGLTFYFSSKNKKLLGHVEELAQRLEEQEDKIQKLETTLQTKIDTINQQMNNGFLQIGQGLTQTNSNLDVLTDQLDSRVSKHKVNNRSIQPPNKIPVQVQSKPILQKTVHTVPHLREKKEVAKPLARVQFTNPPRKSKDESEDEELENESEDEELENELADSDLDCEIREELEELIEHESDLKKET